MIGVTVTMNAALMAAFIARLGAGAYCQVYGDTRPVVTGSAPSGAPVCQITLASPCGVVDVDTGAMVFTATNNDGGNGQITNATAPKWVRFFAVNGDICFDLDARLNGAADLGQEVVLTATALNVGAFMRITGGGFTAA